MRAGAIVVAAGTGNRLGAGRDCPKALVPLAGRPLVWHSLASLEREQRVAAIVVVAPRGLAARFEREVVRACGLSRVTAVVEGGQTRQESVERGLSALPAGLDPVLIHDAARPLVSGRLIRLCLETAAEKGACIAAVPVAATVKWVDSEGRIAETLDRSKLWEAQTPQAFEAGLIRRAHREAAQRGLEATDDAALVEALGVSVYVVPGDVRNLKVTWPSDLELAEALLSVRGGGDQA